MVVLLTIYWLTDYKIMTKCMRGSTWWELTECILNLQKLHLLLTQFAKTRYGGRILKDQAGEWTEPVYFDFSRMPQQLFHRLGDMSVSIFPFILCLCFIGASQSVQIWGWFYGWLADLAWNIKSVTKRGQTRGWMRTLCCFASQVVGRCRETICNVWEAKADAGKPGTENIYSQSLLQLKMYFIHCLGANNPSFTLNIGCHQGRLTHF